MTVLSPDQIAQYGYQAGFRGQSLQWMTQIAMRESGGKTDVYNPNVSTGDNSVGLWQINLLDGNAANIAKHLNALGYPASASDPTAMRQMLSNPLVNAKVAYRLSGGGTNFEPWRSNSPGWEGPQGFLTKTQQYASASASAAMKAQMGQASTVTSMTSRIRSAQRGTGTVGSKLVAWLNQQLGKDYKFGSVGPDTFDCSGLVTAAYRQLGINLPALTFSQVKYGVPGDPNNLQIGDLMLKHGSQGDFGHVGVYIGGGQVIDAPHTGAKVRTTGVEEWLPGVSAQGGTVRRIIDGQGRLIVGAGLVADHGPDVQTVPVSQAVMGSDMPADTSQGVNMSELLGGMNQAQPPAFSLQRAPFSLPGYGSLVA